MTLTPPTFLCAAMPRPLGVYWVSPSLSVSECLSPSLFQNNVSFTIMGLQPSTRLLARPLSLSLLSPPSLSPSFYLSPSVRW